MTLAICSTSMVGLLLISGRANGWARLTSLLKAFLKVIQFNSPALPVNYVAIQEANPGHKQVNLLANTRMYPRIIQSLLNQ